MGLRLKTNQRLRQKIMMRRLVVSSLVMFFVGIGFLMMHLSSAKDAKAAGTYYYTIADGEWCDATVWSTVSSSGPPCNCNPGPNYNGPGITISNKITCSSYDPLYFSGGAIVTVTGNGKLSVANRLEINGGSTLNIMNNDTVIVNGKFTISGSVVNGTNAFFRVKGNVTMSGGSNVCGSGSLTYGGSLTGTVWCATASSGYLPVELTSFSGIIENNITKLNWSTASEKENDYFAVERSSDGIEFTEVLRRTGVGNSNKPVYYTADDLHPLDGNSYYRLKQTDLNGSYYCSKVISVSGNDDNETKDPKIESVFPNPFVDHFVMNYNVLKQKKVNFHLFNNAGKEIYKEIKQSAPGNNTFIFNDKFKLVKGIYFVSIESDDKTDYMKVFKF